VKVIFCLFAIAPQDPVHLQNVGWDGGVECRSKVMSLGLGVQSQWSFFRHTCLEFDASANWQL